MGIEIERKYLIRMPDVDALRALPGCEEWDIVQTYLFDGGQKQTRRVRRIEQSGGVHWVFTQKRHLSALSQLEDEREISREEYEALLREADPALKPIRKKRLRIPHEGHTAEIDVYDFWQDRATLEIEMASEDDGIAPPPYISVIRDVTGEKAYKNRRLAAEIPNEAI